jgi:oxalate decarboxylase/phosphoglucose isomerase-like protein (cupin superfamily)
MTDGLVLTAGAGRHIESAGMTMKVGARQTPRWSFFEVTVRPGFDVGAHVHGEAEEIFYVLDGELELLAFEPRARTSADWSAWESAGGGRPVRGGPGSFMYVPAGCPHAFANRGTTPARMVFLVAPSGHEHYLAEIGAELAAPHPPDPEVIAAIRGRHDIQQLTPLIAGNL